MMIAANPELAGIAQCLAPAGEALLQRNQLPPRVIQYGVNEGVKRLACEGSRGVLARVLLLFRI